MSGYRDLCALAVKYSKRFHDHNDECRILAAKLILGYAAYLECPLDKIKQVELDRTLKPTERTTSLSERVRTIVDPEGFVHFAWRVSFDSPASQHAATELVTFGLRIRDGIAIIREETDFAVNVDGVATWEPLFVYLHRQSENAFSAGHGERTKRIGFVGE